MIKAVFPQGGKQLDKKTFYYIPCIYIYWKQKKKNPHLPSVGGLLSPSSSGPLAVAWEYEGPTQDLGCS